MPINNASGGGIANSGVMGNVSTGNGRQDHPRIKYLIIYANVDDGGLQVSRCSSDEELSQELAEFSENHALRFLTASDSLDDENFYYDPFAHGSEMPIMVIRAEVVIPRPRQVVNIFEIPDAHL